MAESTRFEQGDLFLPGYGYTVHLPAFEGPLDLLLHLIRKHRIDIFDIPISFITEKYLEHLEQMHDINIDIAGEFLVMASELVQIKSNTLLPVEGAEDEDAGEDPRAELVRRLLLYQALKEAAVNLAGLDILKRDVFTHTPSSEELPDPEDAGVKEVDLVTLLKAFRRVLDRRPVETHHVKAEVYHIKDRMFDLAESLAGRERLRFEDLFDPDKPRTRPWLIVTFLAILELTRMRMLRIVQGEQDGEIEVLPQSSLTPEGIEGAAMDLSAYSNIQSDEEQPLEAEVSQTKLPHSPYDESLGQEIGDEGEEDFDDVRVIDTDGDEEE